jgi:hypothetical protein
MFQAVMSASVMDWPSLAVWAAAVAVPNANVKARARADYA